MPRKDNPQQSVPKGRSEKDAACSPGRGCHPRGDSEESLVDGRLEKGDEGIREFVRERYGDIARQQVASCCPPAPGQASCCGSQTTTRHSPWAETLYGKEAVDSLPETVTGVALGCGNPTAFAELQEGEVVLDLGSGGGIDCFLAGRSVGAEGRVIGVDMTADMVRLARENARKMGADNVEFRLGELEHLPVEADSVDVVISNCVINLSPDKDAVFREVFRVLRPGGRLAVSDIVLVGELPPEVAQSMAQWVGCVAGALPKDAYVDKIRAAGFAGVEAEEAGSLSALVPGWGKSVVSARVKAIKPCSCEMPAGG